MAKQNIVIMVNASAEDVERTDHERLRHKIKTAIAQAAAECNVALRRNMVVVLDDVVQDDDVDLDVPPREFSDFDIAVQDFAEVDVVGPNDFSPADRNDPRQDDPAFETQDIFISVSDSNPKDSEDNEDEVPLGPGPTLSPD